MLEIRNNALFVVNPTKPVFASSLSVNEASSSLVKSKKPLSTSVRILFSLKPPSALSNPVTSERLFVISLSVVRMSFTRSSEPLSQLPITVSIRQVRTPAGFSFTA